MIMVMNVPPKQYLSLLYDLPIFGATEFNNINFMEWTHKVVQRTIDILTNDWNNKI